MLGHLLFGLLAGVGALAVALLLGAPVSAAFAAYVVVGALAVVLSAACVAARRGRRPAHRPRRESLWDRAGRRRTLRHGV
ncbi:MAG: hypothetical protein R6V44_03805 [Paracoccaceae bacterium]